METQLLRWIRKHQKTICAELYQGVQDALHNNTWENSGSAVILPATVTGSPRFMHRKCQDALALCGRFGKPYLFITGTTNPDWPEINAQLQPGQTVHDRPDIANRVFHCKLSQMIKMIENGLLFPTKVQGHSIEWQKWGMRNEPLSLAGQAFVRFMIQFLVGCFKTFTYFCGKDNLDNRLKFVNFVLFYFV